MPAKNFLNQEQVGKLQKALRESELPHVRERLLILLLQNDGKTQRDIAKFLGCSPRTVAHWCRHGDPNQLESLHNQRDREHYRKATPEYLKLLLETVEQEPAELGYEFGRWTGERLATYLAEKTGIELSGSQVRRILKRKKYRYIWAKYSLEDKQNPLKRNEFKQKLQQYLAIAHQNPARLQIWFWDETGFSLRVIRRKTWGRRGRRKSITGQRRQGRVNVMGGVRESDRKRICFFVEKGEGDIFYQQLNQLNEWVKAEWVSQRNRAEDFQAKGPKVILI
jgi:transposase